MRGFTHPQTQILLPLARRARSSRPAAETLSGSTGQRIRPCGCRSQDRTAEMRRALAWVIVATASAARLRGAANDDRERRRLNARTRAAHHLAAMATHDDEAWCRSNKHAHHVKPGSSFGTLQADGQKEWVDRKCDQFFCKHHHRTGKGKYKCEPLAIPEEHLLALDNPGP